MILKQWVVVGAESLGPSPTNGCVIEHAASLITGISLITIGGPIGQMLAADGIPLQLDTGLDF